MPAEVFFHKSFETSATTLVLNLGRGPKTSK